MASAGIPPGSSEERDRWMLRTRDAIGRDYAEPLSVPAVARIALDSEAHFIRTFRATFGETPHRYLQRRRVERAMALLRNTDRSVTNGTASASDSGIRYTSERSRASRQRSWYHTPLSSDSQTA
jgi:AraC-like DNA-binding protein